MHVAQESKLRNLEYIIFKGKSLIFGPRKHKTALEHPAIADGKKAIKDSKSHAKHSGATLKMVQQPELGHRVPKGMRTAVD